MRRAGLAVALAALSAGATARAQSRTENVPVTGRPGQGVTVTVDDPAVSLTLSSRVQTRFTATVPTEGDATTEIAIRTLRVLLSGHAFSTDVRYFLQLALAAPDYDPSSASPLFDAWVSVTRLRDLNVRVGQFFVPFDRARTIREATLQFNDRSLTGTEFNLDRDVGVELSSKDLFGLGGRLQYALGVFSGEGRNRASTNAGFLYVGRLQFNPTGTFDDFTEGDLERLSRPRVSIAVAGAYNQSATRARSTVGNALTLGGFDYAHAAADVMFKWAGVSLLGEVVWRHASVDSRASTDAMGRTVTEYSRSGWGALAQVGVMLGPQFELVGRYGRTMAFDGTDPALLGVANNQPNEVAFGANWYIAGHPYKLQADWQGQCNDSFANLRQTVRVQLQLTL